MIENWKDVLIDAAFGALFALICIAAIVLWAPACHAASPPYITLLQFDDGSIEVCPTHGYQINDPFPYLTVQATTCLPDRIFANGFEP